MRSGAYQLLAMASAITASTGLSVAVQELGAFSPPKPAKLLTHCDEERIRKAEAKRARKAAKRLGVKLEGGE